MYTATVYSKGLTMPGYDCAATAELPLAPYFEEEFSMCALKYAYSILVVHRTMPGRGRYNSGQQKQNTK